MSRRNGWWLVGGGVLVTLILTFGYLSQRNFRDTVVGNFNAQQAMFIRSLENAIRDHITEEEQDLQHLIREIRSSPAGLGYAAGRLPILYETHLDNFIGVGIFDGTGRPLHFTPPHRRGDQALLRSIASAIRGNGGSESAFVSERIPDGEGRSYISLIVPFRLGEGSGDTHFAAGILRIEDYMISHFPSWKGKSMGFVLIDDSGDILSMLNTAHETSLEMKEGNLFSLQQACRECHLPSDFDVVRQALRTGDTVHSVSRLPGGETPTNQTTLAFPVMNDTWSLTIYSPFESVQRAIDRNFRSNIALTALSLVLVGALSIAIQKGLGLQRVAETAEALRRSEETLKASSRQLEEANRMKDLFTDIVRHDLLSPVAAAKGYGEILARGEQDQGRLELFSAMGRSLQRLAETIEHSAILSKLEDSGDMEVTHLDLAELIDRAAGGLARALLEKDLGLVRSMKGSYPVRGSTLLEEVFLNLLSNAVKYSPEGGRIEVGIDDRGEVWEAFVKDRGEGIPDEYKEKVFTRLERLQREGVKGTGLGLAIVKRIVDLHGGSVRVEDNPGGGSIFVVSIPKAVRTKAPAPGA